MAAVTMRLAVVLAMSGLAAAQTKYVGSKVCYGCHSEIYRSFLKTDMGRSLSPAKEWSAAVLPASAALTLAGTNHRYEVLHDNAGWRQRESEPAGFSAEHELLYAVGSGANGITFLLKRGDYLFQAPLSYYARTKQWDFSPGYEKAELGFGRVVPEECINCHAGRATPAANRPGAYGDPAFAELAIGCENCHGPAEAHVKSLGKQAGSIVNPKKLTPRLAENICMNCHQSGDTRVLQDGKSYLDFRPGQWLFDTAAIVKVPARTEEQQNRDLLEHYSAMQASQCFRASGGKLGCLTCHDPHVQPRGGEVASYFRAKCLTCHTNQSCKTPLALREAQTPANDCAGCHMPKRSIQQISHSSLTNHRIPARADEAAPVLRQVVNDGLVIVNPPAKGEGKLSPLMLLRAYADLAISRPEYQALYDDMLERLSHTAAGDATVEAALGHKAFEAEQNEAAVEHLKRALPLERSAIYLELGQALGKLGRSEESIEYLKKGAAMDPYNAALQKTLILQYINLKAYPEATVLIKQYVQTFPEDSFMRGILARVSR